MRLMVRIAPGRSIAAAKGDLLLVIGSSNSGEAMVALGGDSKVYWTVSIPTAQVQIAYEK